MYMYTQVPNQEIKMTSVQINRQVYLNRVYYDAIRKYDQEYAITYLILYFEILDQPVIRRFAGHFVGLVEPLLAGFVHQLDHHVVLLQARAPGLRRGCLNHQHVQGKIAQKNIKMIQYLFYFKMIVQG